MKGSKNPCPFSPRGSAFNFSMISSIWLVPVGVPIRNKEGNSTSLENSWLGQLKLKKGNLSVNEAEDRCHVRFPSISHVGEEKHFTLLTHVLVLDQNVVSSHCFPMVTPPFQVTTGPRFVRFPGAKHRAGEADPTVPLGCQTNGETVDRL